MFSPDRSLTGVRGHSWHIHNGLETPFQEASMLWREVSVINERREFVRLAMPVAALVLHERKAANDHSDALDLIANMKQTGAGALAGSHQKIRTASRSTSPTM